MQCRRLRHEPVFFNVAIKYYIPNLDHRHLRVTETLIGEHVPHTTTRKTARKIKFLSLNFATKLQVTLSTHVTGFYERDLLNFFFDRVSTMKVEAVYLNSVGELNKKKIRKNLSYVYRIRSLLNIVEPSGTLGTLEIMAASP